MHWDQLPLLGLLLFGAAVVQSAAGFGYALLLMPSLIYLGMAPEQAVVLTVLTAMVMNAVNAWHLREHVPWRLLLPLAIWGALMLPVGTWLLGQIRMLEPGQIRQVFGGILLFLLVLMWVFQVKPHKRVAWGWGLVAFGASGILSGVAAMSGPPLVLWTMAHDWPAKRSRALLMATYFLWGPLLLWALFWKFGETTFPAARLGVVLLPAVLTGVWVGLRIGNRLSRQQLRRVTMALLTLLAVGAVLQ